MHWRFLRKKKKKVRPPVTSLGFMCSIYNITPLQKRESLSSVTLVFLEYLPVPLCRDGLLFLFACHHKCFTCGLSTMCKWNKSRYAFRFPDVHMCRQQPQHPSSPPPQRRANRLIGNSQIKNPCFFFFSSSERRSD